MSQVKEATNACAGCNMNKTCPDANESDGFEVCEKKVIPGLQPISERNKPPRIYNYEFKNRHERRRSAATGGLR